MSNLTVDGRTLTEAERLKYLADEETGREARADMAIELADLLRECKRMQPQIVEAQQRVIELQASMAARDMRARELQRALSMPVTGIRGEP